MKKIYLNEELNSMKYLFDYKRGRVISEQVTYYKGADGKVGVFNGPYALPQGAVAITQQEYNTASSVQSTPQPSQQTAPQASVTTPQTTQQPTTPQQPGSGSDALELQKLLNSKFQAGLKEDSKIGQLTVAAALKALGGVPKGKTNSSTTTTTTAKPTGSSTTQTNNLTQTNTQTQGQPSVDKGHNSTEEA